MKINSKSNKSDLLARLADLNIDADPSSTVVELRAMISTAEATPALTGTFDGKPVGSKRARRTSPEAAVAAVRAAETPEPVAAEDRVARLAQAKVEKKALDSFVKNGKKGERPATPNLDALAEPSSKAKGSTKAKAEKIDAPAPNISKGETLVTFRTASQALRVSTAIGDVEKAVVQQHYVVSKGAAQATVDAAIAALTEGPKADRYLLNFTLLAVLFASDATDTRNGSTARLIAAAKSHSGDVAVAQSQSGDPILVIDGESFTPSAAAKRLAS